MQSAGNIAQKDFYGSSVKNKMVCIKKKNTLLRRFDNPCAEKRASVKQEGSYKTFFGSGKLICAHRLHGDFLVKTRLIALIVCVALFFYDAQKRGMGRNGFSDSTGEYAQIHIVFKREFKCQIVHNRSGKRKFETEHIRLHVIEGHFRLSRLFLCGRPSFARKHFRNAPHSPLLKDERHGQRKPLALDQYINGTYTVAPKQHKVIVKPDFSDAIKFPKDFLCRRTENPLGFGFWRCVFCMIFGKEWRRKSRFVNFAVCI